MSLLFDCHEQLVAVAVYLHENKVDVYISIGIQSLLPLWSPINSAKELMFSVCWLVGLFSVNNITAKTWCRVRVQFTFRSRNFSLSLAFQGPNYKVKDMLRMETTDWLKLGSNCSYSN